MRTDKALGACYQSEKVQLNSSMWNQSGTLRILFVDYYNCFLEMMSFM